MTIFKKGQSSQTSKEKGTANFNPFLKRPCLPTLKLQNVLKRGGPIKTPFLFPLQNVN